MTALSNVIDQMNAAGLTGLDPSSLVVDGKLHRFRPDWEPKAGKKRGWYVLFYFKTDDGNELVSGAFGWFKGAENNRFNVSLKSNYRLTASERQRFDCEREKKLLLAEKERELEARTAAKRALDIWNKLSDNGHSKYLQQKKVAAFNVKFSRGSVVLPVHDFNCVLSGLQFIEPEGSKKFLTGTIKKARFCLLGKIEDPSGYIGIAEGYSTGASVCMATGWPVFVAFDAGNLIHVAKAVRGKYPRSRIVLCGDDDTNTQSNPGRYKAEHAASEVKGLALFPVVGVDR
jgi:putative DNA primase/helicase